MPKETKSKDSGATPAVRREHPLSELRTQMDQLFENFFSRSPFAGFGSMLEPFPGLGGTIAPRVDVSETDKAVEVTAELPGIDEKEVEVTLSDGLLTIKGEKKEEKEDKQADYYLSERSYGSFHRRFRLPDDIDEAKVSARFDKGILKVTLPKKPNAKPAGRRIPIGR